MLKLSRLSIIAILTILFIIYLPPQFKKLFVKRHCPTNIQYSSLLKKFLIAYYSGEAETSYTDTDGNSYTKVQFQEHLPLVYFRNLSLWKRLPEKIDDIELTALKIKKSKQHTFIKPYEFHKPKIDLYPLYESASIFSTLANPDSMFRINSSMEFIDAETNTINKKISKIFNDELKEKFFKFPPKKIFGNPTTRKPFDEGYFVVDAAGKLFHIKMEKGKPLVRDTKIRPENGIRLITVDENTRKEYYGLMVTKKNEIFLITYDNYKTIKLPVADNYKPDSMSFFMVCDLLKRTITLKNKEKIICIVTDNDYNIKDSYTHPVESYDKKAEKYAGFLFPLSLETTKGGSRYVLFNIDYAKNGLFSAVAALILLCIFLRFKALKLKHHIGDFILVGIAGIPALAAVLIAGGYKVNNSEEV